MPVAVLVAVAAWLFPRYLLQHGKYFVIVAVLLTFTTWTRPLNTLLVQYWKAGKRGNILCSLLFIASTLILGGISYNMSGHCNPAGDHRRLMNTAEAADYLRIHKRTLYALVAQRECAYIRPGNRGHYKFRPADLDAYLAGQTVSRRSRRNG